MDGDIDHADTLWAVAAYRSEGCLAEVHGEGFGVGDLGIKTEGAWMATTAALLNTWRFPVQEGGVDEPKGTGLERSRRGFSFVIP